MLGFLHLSENKIVEQHAPWALLHLPIVIGTENETENENEIETEAGTLVIPGHTSVQTAGVLHRRGEVQAIIQQPQALHGQPQEVDGEPLPRAYSPEEQIVSMAGALVRKLQVSL